MNKKLLFVVLPLLIAISFALPTSAKAATQWWKQDFTTFSQKVEGTKPVAAENEIFGERYTAAQVNWIINSLALAQAGDILQCISSSNPPGGSMNACFQQVGGPGAMGSPILFLASLNDSLANNHIASGTRYIASKINKLNPVQTAYAQQGFGYSTLEPLQPIWIALRNLSFGLMSFVIIILAFMIMFRQKISAQAVITAQSALPKVVIALIFITFSYAIAGLLVDLSYVVLGIISLVASQSGLMIDNNPIAVFNKINNPYYAFTGWVGIITGIMVPATAGGLALGPLTGGIGTAIGAVSGFIAVIMFALGLVAFFRIFIIMLKAFATIVFLIIGSPLIGLASVVSVGPGIGGWVRQMAAQLSVFVGVCASVMLAHMIFWTMAVPGGWLSQALTASANVYGFQTKAIDVGNAILFPGFSGFPIQIIAFFLGFGILFSAPKIASSLRDQIATGRGSYGFDTLGVIAGPGHGAAGDLVQERLNLMQTAAKTAGTSPYVQYPVQYTLTKLGDTFLKKSK